MKLSSFPPLVIPLLASLIGSAQDQSFGLTCENVQIAGSYVTSDNFFESFNPPANSLNLIPFHYKSLQLYISRPTSHSG